jgi:hypothetical protein
MLPILRGQMRTVGSVGCLLCWLMLVCSACTGSRSPIAPSPGAATLSYKVTSDFTATGFPTCAYEIGDIQDHFEFVIVETPAPQGTTYQVQNIVNTATRETNAVINPHLTGTYTPSGTFEFQDVTSGQVAGNGTTLAVTVTGLTTSKTCTWSPPFGPSTTVPGGSVQTAFAFQFNADQVGRTALTLPPVSLPGSNGIWTITLMSQ